MDENYENDYEDYKFFFFRQPTTYYHCVQLLHGIFCLIGILGNLLVCSVIVGIKSMHTVTNCYLFSISIADLILLIGVTITDFITYITETNLLETKTELPEVWILRSVLFTSISIITAFTIERYIAICHPLRARTSSSVSRSVKIIVILWLICIVGAFPMDYPVDLCNESEDYGMFCRHVELISDIWFYIFSLVFFILPLIIISTLYILIGMRISKRRRNFGKDSNMTNESAQKNSLQIMGVIVLVLYICWAPLLTVHIIMRDEGKYSTVYFIFDNFTYLVISLYYLSMLSPVLNPFIYSFMSVKFRIALKEFVRKFLFCWRIEDRIVEINMLKRGKGYTTKSSHKNTRITSM